MSSEQWRWTPQLVLGIATLVIVQASALWAKFDSVQDAAVLAGKDATQALKILDVRDKRFEANRAEFNQALTARDQRLHTRIDRLEDKIDRVAGNGAAHSAIPIEGIMAVSGRTGFIDRKKPIMVPGVQPTGDLLKDLAALRENIKVLKKMEKEGKSTEAHRELRHALQIRFELLRIEQSLRGIEADLSPCDEVKSL